MAHGRPDFSPTAVDVVLRPEWAAKEGTDKDLGGVGILDRAFGEYTTTTYTVTAGKTFYITDIEAINRAAVVGNAELNQMCALYLQVGATIQFEAGGNGGVIKTLSKPIVADAGVVVVGACVNYSAHNTKAGVFIHGYEF